jgi:hypothetical protein
MKKFLLLSLGVWLLRRRRSASTDVQEFVPDAATQRTLGVLIDRAAEHLGYQLGDSDALDLKALGLLTVDVASIAVLVATRDALSASWLLPAVFFALSGLALCEVVRVRSFAVIRDFRGFYAEMANWSAEETEEQMLSTLLDALDENDQIHLPRKIRAGRWGLRALVAGGLASFVIALT